jgi:hypothetical protein
MTERVSPQTARGAVAFARRQRATDSDDWNRQCLRFVRTAWELPAVFPSAHSAWANSRHKHPAGPGIRPNRLPWVPFGAPYFTRPRHAGSDDPWHVVIVGGHLDDGRRLVWSTDIKGRGEVHPVMLGTLLDRWDHVPLGWTHDLNGFWLRLPTSPARRAELR